MNDLIFDEYRSEEKVPATNNLSGINMKGEPSKIQILHGFGSSTHN